MSKLTLPILCAYLPYGLEIINTDGNRKYTLGFGHLKYLEDNIQRGTTHNRLLLRPLSSLTKPITHNGETFVPLVKLANIQSPEVEFTIEDNRCFGRLNVGVVLEFVIDGEIPFYKEYHNNIFGQSKSDDYDDMFVANITPSEIREKMKEWYMDLWNLLESGDALPIEELTANQEKA